MKNYVHMSGHQSFAPRDRVNYTSKYGQCRKIEKYNFLTLVQQFKSNSLTGRVNEMN